jgi:hypothetical protein
MTRNRGLNWSFRISVFLVAQSSIMDNDIDRREFANRTSAVVAGLLSGTLLDSGSLAGQERNEPDKRLVLLGLNALARAHDFNYFTDGHRGASLVAAHLICRKQPGQENQIADRETV